MGLKEIDKLYYREEIIDEVERHNEVFNLEDFYLVDPGEYTPSRTGYRLITSDREYSGYCISHSEHEDVILNILFGLYDDYNMVYKNCNYEWRKTASSLGVVVMQLVSKYYSLMWAPLGINKFQYDCILRFSKEIKEINKKLAERGMGSITIGVCLIKEDGTYEEEIDLDRAIEYLSSHVSFDKTR